MNTIRLTQHYSKPWYDGEGDNPGPFRSRTLKLTVQITEGKYSSSTAHWFPIAVWKWLVFKWKYRRGVDE